MARVVGPVFNPPVAVHIIGKPVSGKTPERYVPSIKRVSKELGLKPLINLETAVKKTVAWHSPSVRKATNI